MTARRPASLLLPAVCAACAAAQPVWAPAARTSPTSCDAPGAPAAAWRLVRADRFTFCVPPDWSSSDGITWRGGAGSIAMWDGVARIVPREQIVSARAGGLPPLDSEEPGCTSRDYREEIGGAEGTLTVIDCGGATTTFLAMERIGIHLRGEPTVSAGATLQLQIFRTVRLLANP